MGLATLLSVGKAIREARDVPHRYRTPSQQLVPRFEPVSRERDRKLAMKTEMNKTQARATRPNRAAVPKVENAPLEATADGGCSVAASGQTKPWWALGAWFSLKAWGMKKPAVTGVFRGKYHGPVQQELALEKVKPCRNDLSDADWEVVPPPPSGVKLAFLKHLASGGAAGPREGRPSSRTAPSARI
ncbi:MAG: hypothetical protein NTW03_13070 [Verrucomicrobia bacterium]|nr:hypothetical protein [Verrucomicrobiota bacterium]